MQDDASLDIALLTSCPGWRGSTASFAKIAMGLVRRGHAPIVITASAPLTDRFRALGVDAIRLDLSDTGPQQVRALRRVLGERRTVAILVDTPRDLRLAVYATLFRKVPIIYRYNLTYRRPRLHLADRLYLHRVDASVFQSGFIEAEALQHASPLRRSRLYRIPNGIDVNQYSLSAEAGARFRGQWGLSPKTFVIVNGSAAANKGTDETLEALRQMYARGDDVAWVLCGIGVRADELRRRADSFGVPAVFTGLLDPEGMIAALNAADAVVHLSPSEVFPNIVAEAMACGRAVIGANSGGLPEVLGRDGETGLLVQPDDQEALAAAIGRLFHDADLKQRLGQAARTRVAREFPLHRMEERYTSMFLDVAGHARRSHGASR